jgi:ribosomal protein L37E
MAKCPACRSTRVYKGYRPAPLLLRLLLIHDFLCENCNLQFRGFSLIPPRSRRRKGKKSSDSASHSSSSVEPAAAMQDAVQAKPVLAQAKSAVAAGLSQTTSMSVPPPTTKQGQWQMPAEEFEELQGKRRSHRSHQICTSCGATDTERRRRKLWEKVVFVFTSIRAYQCRICGADFYARRKKKE